MVKPLLLALIFLCFLTNLSSAQSFGSSGLSGESLNNPTSLQFGPDGRLYVAQQDGTIFAYTIERNGANDYDVTSTETILDVRNIQNHNDDGTINTSVTNREVTGLLVIGTASNPILYVTSSDFRIGGGGGGSDRNLDTNSGVLSRLTKNGLDWDKVDLVRGLPRSEENHASNGIQIDETANILYLAQGGHTNAGSPSNNFAFLTEYALSGAILEIDLNVLDALPVLNDNGSSYVYDLPTLDDPTRPNVNGKDINDPWGGNDGLNQAKLVPGGPVQIYAPGFRNIFDVVLTESGRLYTWDNGANAGWGGHPDNEGSPNVTNNWVPGEPGSTGPGPNDPRVNNRDGLHLISTSNYYGGHPSPIRANPSGAGLFTHDIADGSGGENGFWRTSITGNQNTTLPVDWPPVPVELANPIEADYQNAGETDPSLFTVPASTNGIDEYTASNFNGALQGNLLAASFNGNIYNIGLNSQGSINDDSDVSVLASGFGSSPLDVTAQGDNDIFPGTIWATTYGSDNITVFEPTDFDNPSNPGEQESIYINTGGPSVTLEGINWLGDQYFTGSISTASRTEPIANTSSDFIYQSERYGEMTYNIPVMDGTYDLDLHFAEIWEGAQETGIRIFDVVVEGNLFLNNFDILDEVGFRTATIRSTSVTVTDGFLTIDFNQEVQNPKISGIAVISNQTCTGESGNDIDEDGDGYTNSDELDNGTNPCNGADQPEDFDETLINGFLVSNLNDPDDDDDGILDNSDSYPWDASNGLSTNLPIDYPFLNGDPGTGFFGLGFTGLMTNESADYLDLIRDENNSDTEIIAGGAVGLFSINGVTTGDASGMDNLQSNAFQFGINVDQNTDSFAIEAAVLGPVFTTGSPEGNQSTGFYIGTGDQDNFLRFTVSANNGNPGLEIYYENNGAEVGSAGTFVSVSGIETEAEIKLKLLVNPNDGLVQPQYAFGNDSYSNVGDAIQLTGESLIALQNSNEALAVGVISNSNPSDTNYNATWDYITIEFEDLPVTTEGTWVYVNDGDSCAPTGSAGSCPQGRHEASYVHVGDKFYLLGGRENGSNVNIYDPISDSWTVGATPPTIINHFQAVEYHGLILVVGAFRDNNFPTEAPLDRILIYDPVQDTWFNGPSIPENRRRGSAGVVVHNDKIYMISGIIEGHRSGWVPWMDEYDPATDTWRILPDAPHSRDHFQAAILNGKIYVGGGRRSGEDGTFNATEGAIDIFDLPTETWSINANDIPTERAGLSVAVLGNEVIYIGGERNSGLANNETEALNVNTGTWRTLSPLNTGRHGSQAIVNNGNIYIASGSPTRGGGALQSQERFYFETATTPNLNSIEQATLQLPSQVTIEGGTEIISVTHSGSNQAILVENVSINNGNFQFNIFRDAPFLLKPGESFEVEVSYTGSVNESAEINIEHTGSNGPVSIIDLDSNIVTQTDQSFVPDPNKTYYLDVKVHNLRLAATGESEDAYTTTIGTTGADVEWRFVANGDGFWHIDRAAGGSKPRIRTDDTKFADMQSTESNSVWTYYRFDNGASEGSHYITLPDGPTNHRRLQIHRNGTVRMRPTSNQGGWVSWEITEVPQGNNNTAVTVQLSNLDQIQEIETLSKEAKPLSYPNPTRGEVYVDLSEYADSEVQLTVIDLQGNVRMIREVTKNHSDLIDINLDELEVGIYLLSIQPDDGETIVEKIILMQ